MRQTTAVTRNQTTSVRFWFQVWRRLVVCLVLSQLLNWFGRNGSSAAAAPPSLSKFAVGNEATRYEAMPLWATSGPKPVRRIAISPDGHRLASVIGGNRELGELVVWDLPTRQVCLVGQVDRGIRSVAFSPDGTLVAVGGFDKAAHFFSLQTGQLERTFKWHNGAVTSVAFSPDGKRLATATDRGDIYLWDVASQNLLTNLLGLSSSALTVTFSPDGRFVLAGGRTRSIRIWDAATGVVVRTIDDLPDVVQALRVSPDGSRIAATLWGGSIKIWDSQRGTELATFSHKDPTGEGKIKVAVAFSSDGRLLATGGLDGHARIWATSGYKEVARISAHPFRVWSVAFSPDGRRLYSSGDTITAWNVETGRELFALARETIADEPLESALAVAYSPNGKLIATGHTDRTVRLRDAATGQLRDILRGHEDAVSSLAFAPDGETLASSSYDNTTKLWDLGRSRRQRATDESVAKRRTPVTLRGYSNWIMSVAYSPDGKWLATGSYDQTINLWDADSGRKVFTFEGHSASVRCVAFSQDGCVLASGSSDQTVRLWDVASRKATAVLREHSASIRAVAFSSSSRTLATASEDESIKLWDLPEFPPDEGSWDIASRATLIGHDEIVWCLAFSPDGGTLASGGLDNQIRLWDPSTATQRFALRDHTEGVTSLAFAPDASQLISVGMDHSICVWRAKHRLYPSELMVRAFTDHENAVWGIDFSPDGRQIVTTRGQRSSTNLWEAESGTPLHRFESRSPTLCVAFSPDGQRIASAGYDQLVTLWDVASRSEIRRLAGHRRAVRSVVFSPDGRQVASGAQDGAIRVWHTATGELVHTLESDFGEVLDLQYSSNGQMIAATSIEACTVWYAESGEQLHQFAITEPDRRGLIANAKFDPTGDRLLTACGALILWDAKTGKRLKDLGSDGSFVQTISLFPDGQRALAGNIDGSISIWDLRTGRISHRFEAHEGEITRVAISPDGRQALTGSMDRTVRLWDLTSTASTSKNSHPSMEQAKKGVQ